MRVITYWQRTTAWKPYEGETSEIDLVIMDLAMPKQEGIETIRILNRMRPRLRIIAMSGIFAGPLLQATELWARTRRSRNPFGRTSCWPSSRG